MPFPVLSTYRLQLRGPSAGDPFTFADAETLLDYLAELGVSHLYLSPILTASPGSTHGYDVVDPTSVSAELGGSEGLSRLSDAAKARGMGLVVDIVPNHVGVQEPEHNPWWLDVLRHGHQSPYASYFDIDRAADDDGRIVLPVLGSDTDIEHLTVDGDVLTVHGRKFPIAPGTADDGAGGAEVHDRQHYKLTGWRTGVCGYRRFFSITELAGLRQEDPAVFDASHAEVARWFAEGVVDGVRIDHPDGLADPAGYLAMLRDLIGPRAWIVIEKILANGEPLDPSLPINGTTGYDVLREVGGVFVDPGGAGPLTDLVRNAGFDDQSAPKLLRQLKIEAATDTLRSELRRLCRAIEAATNTRHPELPTAVAAVLANIGVYRFDYLTLSSVLSVAISQTVGEQPELDAPLGILTAALAVDTETATRLQQLCGAVTAKAVEDCYFYRDARLVSLNEVGGTPSQFGVSAAEFHQSAAMRGLLWPTTMTTLSTHDTKRGEDVRARIGVLSQVPEMWSAFVAEQEATLPSPDPTTGLFLWQNIFGAWPANGEVTDQLRRRLHRYAEKAIREAAVHTSWADPDEAFETAVHRWLDTICDGPAAAALTRVVQRLQPHAHNDALGQKLLALTVPGVPDIYQGTEVWEDSLVDPDNRRPVDFQRCRAELNRMEHPKMRVVAAALRARRNRARTFLTGGHFPVLARGVAAGHIVSYRRGDDVLVAVTRWTVRLNETGWQDTTLPLPGGTWVDSLSGRRWTGVIPAAELFTDLPVVLLEKTDDA